MTYSADITHLRVHHIIDRNKLIVWCAVVLTAGINWACQRPFVAISDPEAEVVQPDLSTAQLQSEIILQVKVSSFREITRVSVDNKTMSHDVSSDIWEAPVTLSPGLNMLLITSFDEEDRPGVDTVYAIHLDFELDDTLPQLPRPIGGHTSTRLSDGSVLVTGGAPSTNSPASANSYIFLPTQQAFEEIIGGLRGARVGHTATYIGNDRVLIIGGGSRAEIDEVGELVETVELYTHSTRSIRELVYVGSPIRRMYHTAVFRAAMQGPIIDVIGGTGDVQYVPEPLLATRADIRSFQLRGDTLFALTSSIGPFIERLSGHTQIPLGSPSSGEPAAFLITGVGGIPPDGPIGLIVDFTTNLGILVDPVILSFSPRSFHAAVKLDDQMIGFFGGFDFISGEIDASGELYVHAISTSFTLPIIEDARFIARYAHTATLIEAGNVLLLGGFDDFGNGLARNRLFSFSVKADR